MSTNGPYSTMQLFDEGFLGDIVLWGVPLGNVILATVLIILGFLSRRIIRSVVRSVLRRAETNSHRWDNDILELLPPPLSFLAQVGIWYGAALLLNLPETATVDVREVVFQSLRLILVLGLVWLGFALIDFFSRVLSRLTTRTHSRLDDQLVPLLRRGLKVLLCIVVGIIILESFDVSVTSLIASLGLGGLAFALAAKDSVANIFGSFVIFADKPFQIGDAVKIEGTEGVVEEVGFRTTRLRTFDKTLVTIPNQSFTTSQITNLSDRPFRRLKFAVGLSYATTAGQMRDFLQRANQVLESHPDVDQSATFFARLSGLGASSLDVEVYCFTRTSEWEAWLALRESLLLQFMELVDELQLEIAFPTRTVHVIKETS